jgi:hypothetical protein
VPQTEFALGRTESGHISSLTINAVTRLAIGLLIAALIVIAPTNPSGAQLNKGVSTENTPSSAESADRACGISSQTAAIILAGRTSDSDHWA